MGPDLVRLIEHLVHSVTSSQSLTSTSIMPRARASFVALSATLLTHLTTALTIGSTVNTTSGPVIGHPASDANQVSEYLGIPYAKPPSGQLRFEPPQPYNGNALINGSSFGVSCPTDIPALANQSQAAAAANLTSEGLYLLRNFLEEGTPMGEDCLTLNVWSKPQTGDSKKAVMLWLYGGGFKNGVTCNVLYNGKYIADQEDVIVVSPNYRGNIFGFPGNPTGRQNLGLLDQRLAVEWVRDNIEHFGGDPSRITLWGQSAGGVSADYWKYAYVDPIVSSFIIESGAANGIPSRSLGQSAADWFNVTSKLNCGDASANYTQVLSCMKTKPFQAITAARGNLPGLGFVEGEFTPTADNITVFSDYNARSRSGTFAKLPTLTGNVIKEDGFLSALVKFVTNETEPDSFWSTFTHQNFTCASAQQANVTVSRGVPTWRYLYFGDFANIAITPFSGAYHESELPLIFDNVPALFPESTKDQVAIAMFMRKAWAAFARDPADGLALYWPAYDPAKATLARLGLDNAAGLHLAMPAGYDTGCEPFFQFPLTA